MRLPTKETLEKKLRRRYRFFKYGFFALLMLLGYIVYSHYDYWVFKLLIAENYIFTDALDQVYAEAVGADNVKGYRQDFERMVMAVVTEKIRSVNRDGYTYLYTPQKYQISKATEREDAKTTVWYPLSEQTAYVYIPNISDLTRAFLYDNKEALSAYQNLVLDLRGNYGGLLADFYAMADLFVAKGRIVGYEKMRLPFLTHAVKSTHEPYFTFAQIIILQDGYTASAAEGLILALKQHLPGVTLLGETTFGKGIGQVTLPLTGGYAIRATVLLVQGPDGNSIHRTGIAPDVAAEADWIQQALRLLEAAVAE